VSKYTSWKSNIIKSDKEENNKEQTLPTAAAACEAAKVDLFNAKLWAAAACGSSSGGSRKSGGGVCRSLRLAFAMKAHTKK
jgi:hypothetical protein